MNVFMSFWGVNSKGWATNLWVKYPKNTDTIPITRKISSEFYQFIRQWNITNYWSTAFSTFKGSAVYMTMV